MNMLLSMDPAMGNTAVVNVGAQHGQMLSA
jgi:hypothetical protein